MISETYCELFLLQKQALSEVGLLNIPHGPLRLAANPGQLVEACDHALDAIDCARAVAMKLPRGSYSRAVALTEPARLALEALRAAAFDEFCIEPERRVG